MPPSSVATIQERRSKVREYMELLLTPRQIWEQLQDRGWSEDTIRRDVAYWRVQDRLWAKKHATVESRTQNFHKLLVDAQQRLISQTIIQALGAGQPGAKAAFLGVAQRGLEHLARLLSLTGLTFKDVQEAHELQQLRKDVDELKRQVQLPMRPALESA